MSEEKTLSLVSKLANVMKEVKYIQKRGYNKFHKYNYATEADVNEKVGEELSKANIIMIPNMVSHDTREHTNRNGNVEYIVTVNMEFRFICGDSGQEITFNMSGSGQDAGDKGIFKAISGAQKYALMKVFMIATGDDPEGDSGVDERNHSQVSNSSSNQPNTNTNQPPKKLSEGQVKRFFAIAKDCNINSADITPTLKKYYGTNKVEELSKQQYDEAIERMQNKAKKEA